MLCILKQDVVVHIFNPKLEKAEEVEPCELEASLIYILRARSTRPIELPSETLF